MKHAALDGAAQPLRIDDQPAVVRANESLHPNAASSAIHLDLGNLCDHRLAAVGIRNTPPGENVSISDRSRRRTSIPTISLRRSLEYGDGARPLEPVVIGGA